MPLLTHKQVRPWSSSIREAVLLRKMPPWFADPQYGKFRNDRRLSEGQIATLAARVNAGSPKGDRKHMKYTLIVDAHYDNSRNNPRNPAPAALEP